MRRNIASLIPLTLVVVLAACGPSAVGESADQPTRPVAAVHNAETVPSPIPDNSGPVLPLDTPVVQAAVEDLSEKLGVPSEEITVLRAEPVTWSDGSLGCPQPDMMYTQALVEGTFLQLQVGDDRFSYHSGGSQEPFLCESAVPVEPGEQPPGAVGRPTS